MNYLFNIFQQLQKRIPYFKIGSFPTPVQRLDRLCRSQNRNNLYIKRDDVCGTIYGGNKVRKLEFLLGDALYNKATRVITSGAAGSNHARATATYSSLAGLKSTLMLFDQVPSPTVNKNLLADYYHGATMYCDETYESHYRHFHKMVECITQNEGKAPYVIPAGGSSPVGTIGFVNAAFELKHQVDSGLIREPHAIFSAFGTMGTVAGLLLGCKAAGLVCTIHASRVVPGYVADREKCLKLADTTNRLLHDSDTTFPVLSFDERDLVIDDTCFGSGYGIPTEACQSFINLIHSSDSIDLDIVYTGKCGASFFDYIQQCDQDTAVLFWNTKNSHNTDTLTSCIDFKQLPLEFHKYFA